jgi:hypothetical protein
METIFTDILPTLSFVEITEPPPLHLNAAHQVKRWRHAADWWSGKIVPHVLNAAKAEEAEVQVRVWT